MLRSLPEHVDAESVDFGAVVIVAEWEVVFVVVDFAMMDLEVEVLWLEGDVVVL